MSSMSSINPTELSSGKPKKYLGSNQKKFLLMKDLGPFDVLLGRGTRVMLAAAGYHLVDSERKRSIGYRLDALLHHISSNLTGTGPNEHIGNVRYRALVRDIVERADLMTGNSNTKRELAIRIVSAVKSKGGRFVKKATTLANAPPVPPTSISSSSSSSRDGRTNASHSSRTTIEAVYEEVSDSMAQAKTKQSFRHQLKLMHPLTDARLLTSNIHGQQSDSGGAPGATALGAAISTPMLSSNLAAFLSASTTGAVPPTAPLLSTLSTGTGAAPLDLGYGAKVPLRDHDSYSSGSSGSVFLHALIGSISNMSSYNKAVAASLATHGNHGRRVEDKKVDITSQYASNNTNTHPMVLATALAAPSPLPALPRTAPTSTMNEIFIQRQRMLLLSKIAQDAATDFLLKPGGATGTTVAAAANGLPFLGMFGTSSVVSSLITGSGSFASSLGHPGEFSSLSKHLSTPLPPPSSSVANIFLGAGSSTRSNGSNLSSSLLLEAALLEVLRTQSQWTTGVESIPPTSNGDVPPPSSNY